MISAWRKRTGTNTLISTKWELDWFISPLIRAEELLPQRSRALLKAVWFSLSTTVWVKMLFWGVLVWWKQVLTVIQQRLLWYSHQITKKEAFFYLSWWNIWSYWLSVKRWHMRTQHQVALRLLRFCFNPMFLAEIHTFAIVERGQKYGASDFWGSSLVIALFIPNLFVENPRRRGKGSRSYWNNAWNDGIMGFEVINQKPSTSSPRTCVHHIVPSQADPTDTQYVFECSKIQWAAVKFLFLLSATLYAALAFLWVWLES